ncbi:methyl-accepting chemotaxis protein [Clostridium sp.]|uniref:methyl-accepting chemotaxis protein n=1 Tax=Clostridium sp. TaxID=1506 RepID=UPI00284BD434|nr:methyl-accepting chemotaxis protein [Clostridium sp.]MDR3596004.1 methyl-accepting chemotaxis protein [Clostridium sp.]
MKMQRKISLLASLLVTMSLMVTMIIGYLNINTFTTSILNKDLDTGLKNANSKLADYFAGIQFRLETINQTGVIQKSLTTGDTANIADITQGLKGANDVIKRVYVKGVNGQIVSSPQKDEDVEDINALLTADTLKKVNGMDAYWVGPYPEKVSGDKVFTVVKAVKDGNNMVAYIGMDIQLKDMAAYLSQFGFAKTGYILLLDDNGKVISNKNDFTKLYEEYDNKELLNAALSSTAGQGEVKLNDGSYKYSIAEYPGLNWKVISLINVDEYQDTINQYFINSFIAVILIYGLVIAISMYFSRKFTVNLNKISSSVKEMGQGNLKVETNIKANDEIGQLAQVFDGMVRDFRGIIVEIQDKSQIIKERTAETKVAYEQTGQAAESITSNVEEITTYCNSQYTGAKNILAETNELSNVSETVSKAVKNMIEACSRVSVLNGEGIVKVTNLTTISEKNNELLRSLNEKVNEITENSKAIDTVIETINTITEQTNLLSLNASIEAARAGESGKGFAVVANEIRKLAEECQKSTVQIRTIIDGMKRSTDDMLGEITLVRGAMLEQNEAVEATESSFKNTSLTISEVEDLVSRVSELNNIMIGKQKNVDLCIKDIVNGIEETTNSITSISSSTEEQCATIEELTASSEQFLQIAENLNDCTSKFKV